VRKINQKEINQLVLASNSQSNLAAKSSAGVSIIVVAQILSIAIQIANTMLLSRILEPDDFGVVAMAMVITGFVSLFADMGLSVAIVQNQNLDQNTANVLFYTNLIAGIAAMFVCLLFSPLTSIIYGDERVKWVVIGMSLVIPVSAATVQYEALMSRNMRFRENQMIGIGAKLFATIISVLLAAYLNCGYWSLVGAYHIAAITKLIGLLVLCQWRPSSECNWTSARSSFKFGLYLTGFNFTLFLSRQIDVALIGYFWGARETGFYSRAYQLMLIPLNSISGPLSSVFIPVLSKVQSEPQRWRNVFIKAFRVSATCGCACAASLTVVSDLVVEIVCGAGWNETALIFRWLSFAMICIFPLGAMAWAFVSLGRTKQFFWWGIITLATLAPVFALTAKHGALYVAVGYCIAVWLLTPACFYLALSGTPVSFGDAMREILPIWCCGIGSIVLGLCLRNFINFDLYTNFAILSLCSLTISSLLTFFLALIRPDYGRTVLEAGQLLRKTVFGAK
jgi:polysaccharide transporter, PST family